MRFRLTESYNYGGLLYRGVGRNLHKSHLQSGGRFYADCPEDASQYGDIIQVVKLSNTASIFKGNSSYKFCKDNGLMDVEYDTLSAITYGECSTLRCVVEEFLDDGTDNIHYRAFQCVACEELRERGYDGAEWEFEDELIPHQFQIWNPDVLINCGTLRAVWENGKERFIAESLVESFTEVDSQGNELTREQISFFRNSKVRDRNGNLLVCYHASASSFDSFDKVKIGSGNGGANFGRGFYFTPLKSIADEYGEAKEYYLNIVNPYHYYHNDKNTILSILDKSGYEYKKEYIDSLEDEFLLWDADLIDDVLYSALVDASPWDALSDMLIKSGYDGIIADDEIIAFEPNQIKRISNRAPTDSDNLNETGAVK